jgi:hypothetical protein
MGQDAAIDRPILHTLANGPMHGYAIAEAIGHFSERPQWLEERELYAALHRLEFEGILSSEWNVGEDRRRAKYYRLRKRTGMAAGIGGGCTDVDAWWPRPARGATPETRADRACERLRPSLSADASVRCDRQ